MKLPDDWVEEERYGYSPSRYDPDDGNYECNTCETNLRTYGDGHTASKRCPQCDVTVWLY